MSGTPQTQIIDLNSTSTITSPNGTQVTTIIVNHAVDGGQLGTPTEGHTTDIKFSPNNLNMKCLICEGPKSNATHNGSAVLQPISKEDKQWSRKYHKFICSEFRMNLPGMPIMNGAQSGTGMQFADQQYEDRVPFCTNCKIRIENLYEAALSVEQAVLNRESIRDEIAKSLTRAFVNKQYEQEDTTLVDEHAKSAVSLKIFNRWKKLYTGVADNENKEKYFINEIKELATQNALKEQRARIEFPEGSGLSSIELAKMQRLMTACYFTPKMSVVRKRNKLFFQVGLPKAKDEDAFKCATCEATFPYQRSLTIHNRAHKLNSSAKKKLHRCMSCGELFMDRKDLVLHKRHHLPIEKRLQEAEKQYQCTSCGQRFRSKTARSVHFNRSHLHRCDICQDSFSYSLTLDLHKQIHEHVISPTELITCKQCPKSFLKPENLMEHLKIHMDQSLVPCVYCAKGFENKDVLVEHFSNFHVEPNPFNCEICELKFESENLLITHLKYHKTQYHTCEICAKIYRSRDGLKKHQGIHAGKKVSEILTLKQEGQGGNLLNDTC